MIWLLFIQYITYADEEIKNMYTIILDRKSILKLTVSQPILMIGILIRIILILQLNFRFIM
jgi:hypothetical protein